MKKRVAIFFILFIFVGILGYGFYQRAQAKSVVCGNYMVSISCAASQWAYEHDGKLPPDLLCMSNNFLSSPTILICPQAHEGPKTMGWSTFSTTNTPYEVLVPGLSATNTETAYFRCKIHGHLGYVNGVIFDGKEKRGKRLW